MNKFKVGDTVTPTSANRDRILRHHNAYYKSKSDKFHVVVVDRNDIHVTNSGKNADWVCWPASYFDYPSPWASGGFVLREIGEEDKPFVIGVDLAKPQFKVGDWVECTESYSDQFTAGKKYKVTDAHDDRILVALDDRGSTQNGWCADKFKLTTAPKSRGEIIMELRRAAGLPVFAVGDVVNWTAIRSSWQMATVLAYVEQTYKGVPSITVDWNGHVGMLFEDEAELITPAPAVAPQQQAAVQIYLYEVGEFVRFKGRPAYIEDIDYEDDEFPYLVTYVDEYDGEWCGESEFEPWVPKVGDRVEAQDEYTGAGTVTAIDLANQEVTVKWDDGIFPDQPWHFTELEPSDVPAPVGFKRGDVVEIAKTHIFRPGIKVGDLGLIKAANDNSIELVVNHDGEGAIVQWLLDENMTAGFIRHAS